ncbi:hypothetical protein [Microbulbifer yueqingensis]|uniref:Lipoprotein n=1 Tax=Microbulbifer yueqingensis TaxID=658219 RepID=A0A1G8VK61_9GAMM|nr:hypothetical protein [Microbulbifer yueqingensis]SDJ66287.1 hypothetical protein SAMN05216212_0601 [Microbulbifer yueqingensis]
MNNKKILSHLMLPVLPLLLAACTSSPSLPVPGLKESFHTEIAANGAKRFTYSLEIQRPDFPEPVTSSSVNRTRISQAGMVQQRPRVRPLSDRLRFNRMLRQKLTETGFCRDGFLELERTEHAYGGEVRGECRDGAGG